MTLGKNYGIRTLRGYSFIFKNLAVNKLITDKTQNTFYLVAEHSGLTEYFLS